jgi:hypothetical protein
MSYDYDGIAQFHDPELLRRRGECYRKLDDPFSKESIRFRRFTEELSGGGTFEVTENATGEVVNTITIEGSRPGAAHRN